MDADQRLLRISNRINDLDRWVEDAAIEFGHRSETAKREIDQLQAEADELRGFDPEVSERVRTIYS